VNPTVDTLAGGRARQALAWCRRERHFLIAAAILGVCWLSWDEAVRQLKIVTYKKSIPWPATVELDTEDFRMLSLPVVIGPYRRAGFAEAYTPKDGLYVTDDGKVHEVTGGKLRAPREGERFKTSAGGEYRTEGGTLYGVADDARYQPGEDRLRRARDSRPVEHAGPDGERVYGSEMMESLQIGTSVDKKRVARRRSNWYLSRVYLDTRKRPGQKYRRWHLDVVYYTGGLDKIPHVPERCLRAAGMTLRGGTDVEFHVPAAPGAWGRPFLCRRIDFENPRTLPPTPGAQYYVFSLNGAPEHRWTTVRDRLSWPFGMKHAYFAKIQFDADEPRRAGADLDGMDEATREFLGHVLPEILKTIPMPDYIERLESGAVEAEN